MTLPVDELRAMIESRETDYDAPHNATAVVEHLRRKRQEKVDLDKLREWLYYLSEIRHTG